MDGLRWLAFGCAALLVAACASEPRPEPGPTPSELGPPVEREGVVYTPASIGPRGCVLYRVSVPGGRAPAALVYRSTDGEFSYGRPDRCVAAASGSDRGGTETGSPIGTGDRRKNGAWDGIGGPGGGFRLESEGRNNVLIS